MHIDALIGFVRKSVGKWYDISLTPCRVRFNIRLRITPNGTAPIVGLRLETSRRNGWTLLLQLKAQMRRRRSKPSRHREFLQKVSSQPGDLARFSGLPSSTASRHRLDHTPFRQAMRELLGEAQARSYDPPRALRAVRTEYRQSRSCVRGAADGTVLFRRRGSKTRAGNAPGRSA